MNCIESIHRFTTNVLCLLLTVYKSKSATVQLLVHAIFFYPPKSMQETTTNSYLTCAQNSCKALKRVLICVIQTMTAFNGLLLAVQSPNVSRSSSRCNEALEKQRKDFWFNFTYLQGAWKRGKKDVLNDIMELWQNYFNLS